jgi:molybdopterin converting factor small subunit
MKTYKAIFKEEETEGVFGISLVHDPAMKGQFIALSKHEKIQFKALDEEKRILVGLVLEPNKPIYRNQNGHEFNIVFDEQTVKDLSYNFFKANHHQNSSIEHETPIDGVTFVESWIVEDTEKDKSTALGLSYPKGSWIATMKVDSDEVWSNYVKEGKVLGFSIDAIIKLEEVEMEKTEQKLSASEKFVASLKDVLGLKAEPAAVEPAVVVALGSAKTKDGEVTVEWEGEELAKDVKVFVTTPEGEKIPLPAGTYEMEDGNQVVVAEEGIVSEVMPTAAAEKPIEEMAQEEGGDAAPTEESLEDVIERIKKITVQYSAQVDEKAKAENVEFIALKKQVDELKVELASLKEEPAKPTIKSQPTQVEFSKMSNYEKLKYNRGK